MANVTITYRNSANAYQTLNNSGAMRIVTKHGRI